MKRFAADQAKYNRLRSELAAFLQEAQRTGHLDEQKLAEYQGQMKHLQAELQSLLGR
jgi:predicted NACHT family NTPase